MFDKNNNHNHKYSDDNHGNITHDHDHGHPHGASIYEEFMHHLPYAVISSALALMVLSFVSFFSNLSEQTAVFEQRNYFTLFHNFHLMHILFSASGTVLMFSRYSKSLVKTLLVGFLSPAVFCVLSDVIIPYLGGIVIGAPMTMHICFICPKDSISIFMFLLIGVINGMVLRKHGSAVLDMFSLSAHFMHILMSALASLFYMVSHGFTDWSGNIAYIFVFLIIAVVIPCTFSDVIVPLYFSGSQDEKY